MFQKKVAYLFNVVIFCTFIMASKSAYGLGLYDQSGDQIGTRLQIPVVIWGGFFEKTIQDNGNGIIPYISLSTSYIYPYTQGFEFNRCYSVLFGQFEFGLDYHLNYIDFDNGLYLKGSITVGPIFVISAAYGFENIKTKNTGYYTSVGLRWVVPLLFTTKYRSGFSSMDKIFQDLDKMDKKSK